MLDFLADNPVSHRIDVKPDYVAADAVSFQKGRSTSHKGIGDCEPFTIVCAKVGFPKVAFAELCKQQSSKKGPRASCKPFMDRDNRPIVLLNLFLAQRESG